MRGTAGPAIEFLPSAELDAQPDYWLKRAIASGTVDQIAARLGRPLHGMPALEAVA